MSLKTWKWAALCGLLVFAGGLVALQIAHAEAQSNSSVDVKIIHYLRERFDIAPTDKVTVAPLEPSAYADFYNTKITVVNGKNKSVQDALVTRDGRYLIFGQVFSLNADPATEVVRSINLKDQPSVGPANAPVTIVEFADLQCPTCALLQKVFNQDILPKYGNKVRIVIKDFPLYQIHDWALTAAIASQCAYEENPSLVFKYRTTIYANQSLINGTNVRTLLLDYAESDGLSRLHMATCIDSRATMGRVLADIKEGRNLSVNQTPSCFVNGKLVVGANPQQYYQAIDADLRARR